MQARCDDPTPFPSALGNGREVRSGRRSELQFLKLLSNLQRDVLVEVLEHHELDDLLLNVEPNLWLWEGQLPHVPQPMRQGEGGGRTSEVDRGVHQKPEAGIPKVRAPVVKAIGEYVLPQGVFGRKKEDVRGREGGDFVYGG